MVGGKIGKDGIHGATFSSAELDKESPVQQGIISRCRRILQYSEFSLKIQIDLHIILLKHLEAIQKHKMNQCF